MLGLLPCYLNQSGYSIDMIVENKTKFLIDNTNYYDNISNYFNISNYVNIIESDVISIELLDDIDVILLININKTFNYFELDILWSFVENGGSLVVVGDHTNARGIQNSSNILIKKFDMEFNFDTAIPIDLLNEWETCIDLPSNVLSNNIINIYEMQIELGASLKIGPNSHPIILGKYSFSDKGNEKKESFGYLGNLSYDYGEQIGDIVLAAYSNYGNGKAIVFGDSSIFENAALPYSFSFLSNSFTDIEIYNYESIILISMLIISTFIIILIAYKEIKMIKKLTVYTILISFILIFSIVIITNDLQESNNNNIKNNVIYIDYSHNELFNIKPKTANSLSGFMLNSFRNKYLPIINDKLSDKYIEDNNIIVFQAPTEKISIDDVKYLNQYIENGGCVFLFSGYENRDSIYELLNNFNIDIIPIALGSVPYIEGYSYENISYPRFVDAWPIDISKQPNSEILYGVTINNETYIIAVNIPIKSGNFIFISDSKFLLDSNIEDQFSYWNGNIYFIYEILNINNKGGLI
jgi:uncharacterized membrane protein